MVCSSGPPQVKRIRVGQVNFKSRRVAQNHSLRTRSFASVCSSLFYELGSSKSIRISLDALHLSTDGDIRPNSRAKFSRPSHCMFHFFLPKIPPFQCYLLIFYDIVFNWSFLTIPEPRNSMMTPFLSMLCITNHYILLVTVHLVYVRNFLNSVLF